MRIAIVLDVDNRTGASVAAERLVSGLTRDGHTVKCFVRLGHGGSLSKGFVLQPRGKLLRAGSNLGPRFVRARMESTATLKWLRTSLEAYRPDVINIHSFVMTTGGSIPFEGTEVCYRIAPTVWTLHDMWTFTGRCIYSMDCRKFETGCDSSCPTPNEFPVLPPERIRGEWLTRHRILERCPLLAAITPSRWLAGEARAGMWKDHRLEVIPYGLPLDVFRALPRESARQMLGIQASGPVVLCGAWGLGEKRKGIEQTLAALRSQACDRITLVSMGRGTFSWKHGPYVSLGAVDDDRLKAIAYSAADLYIHAANADNLPNMVLEALACGTPVVAFPAGGVPDMVRPGVSGWLSTDMTVDGLSAALGEALVDLAEGRTLRDECRSLAESEYPEALQAQRYASFYSALLRDTPRPNAR